MSLPNKAIQADAVENIGIPLTAKGGPYELQPSQQEILCFLPDGRLLVSRSHMFTAEVKGFMARIKRLEVTHTIHPVEMSVISKAYTAVSQYEKGEATSNMQVAAKQIFYEATQKRASDIHIRVSTVTKTHILFRIHGSLEWQAEHTYEFGDELTTAIYQAMADIAEATFEKGSPQDARIANKRKLPAGLDGIRIATTAQTDGHVMVLRLLYDDARTSLDALALGYTAEHAAAFDVMAMKPFGINIIGGPTGSGKSTTLQRRLLTIIRDTKGQKHVITIEDPAEYPIPGAVQTSIINAATEEERSAAMQKAIKAAMRLDPDVMMIGEMRDAPSVRLAVQAAMTGHNVWSTLHGNGWFALLDRMIEMGAPVDFVCDPTIVTGIACQRLVKVLCPCCRTPLSRVTERYAEADLQRVMKVVSLVQTNVIGAGCDACVHTGIQGRTVVAEVVVTDEKLMAFARRRDRVGAIRYWRNEMGGKTMLDHAIAKVKEGVCDPFLTESIVGPLTDVVFDSDLSEGPQ
ncbi:GspE/PulE family protein [Glaciimonas sp. GG7]